MLVRVRGSKRGYRPALRGWFHVCVVCLLAMICPLITRCVCVCVWSLMCVLFVRRIAHGSEHILLCMCGVASVLAHAHILIILCSIYNI